MSAKNARSLADLPPPIVDAALEDGGDGKPGLLPIEAMNGPLKVEVPLWDGPDPTEEEWVRLKLYWNNEVEGNVQFTGPVSMPFLKFNVREAHKEERVHTVHYVVEYWDDSWRRSLPVTLTSDRTPPALGADEGRLMFPPEIIEGGITEDYLKANGDKVLATVPTYNEPVVGDVISWYWDSTEDEDAQVSSRTLTAGDIGQTLVLEFPGAMLRERGYGDWLARYRIRDRSGNVSDYAAYVSIEMREQEEPEPEPEPEPGPGGLAWPYVSRSDLADAGDGTLQVHVIHRQQGLQVWIEAWRNLVGVPGQRDTLRLEWAAGAKPDDADFKTVAELEVEGPASPNSFPRILTVSARELEPDGPYRLRYSVESWTGSGILWSASIPVICDTTPPFGTRVPAAATAPNEPITDAYLEENPLGVRCMLPAYADWRPGDLVQFWWLNSLPDDPSTIAHAGFARVETNPQEIIIPKAHVEATGDGGCYLVYRLVDKAHNRSHVSDYTPVAVALGKLPANLRDPVVPQAAKGWIDLLDAHAGVVVEIPAFENWKPSDLVEVTWGNTVLPVEELGSVPDFPKQIRVPLDTLKSEYGQAENEVTTAVSYRVLRGDVPFGPYSTEVQVNFTVIGPELPEWPDPVNPELSPLRVYGAVSETLNTLTREDHGQDARVELELYDPLAAGEVVDVYWNNVWLEQQRYTVKSGDRPGDTIVVNVPWTYIEQAGNQPALPVHYRISDPDSPNEQHAPITPVNADAVVITPDAPTFPDVSDRGLLNCQSLDGDDHAIRVQVPDLSAYLAAGDEVTLTWTPLSGWEGEDILDEAIKEETIVLGAGAPATGFIWRVQPYEKHILPTYDPGAPGIPGRARITYHFTRGGERITSHMTEALVAMFDAVGSCPLRLPG